MYALAATQACIATFIIKPTEATQEPIVDAHSAFVPREKNLDTTLSGRTRRGGTLRKKGPGRKAKRLLGKSKSLQDDLRAITRP
jgi:hypothetical protein